jgi:YaiO family outer membrane protein
MRRLALATALVATATGSALGQRPSGWLQADAFYHRVTNEFGDWKGSALRLVTPAGRSSLLHGEVVAQEAFGDAGVWGSVGWRQQWGPSWFSLTSAGGGTGDSYFPDLRSDLLLGRAWLPRRNLVTMVGGTYVKAKRVYRDRAVSGSLAFYFAGGAAELGGRFNWSDPDAVRTERIFGALTLGRDRHRFVTLRGSAGREGYQLAGAVEIRHRFRSQEASLLWREWFSDKLGGFLALEWYDNPFYTRQGVTVGLFRHW